MTCGFVITTCRDRTSSDPSGAIGASEGPVLDDLMGTRKTVLLVPDGKSVAKVDDWRKDGSQVDDIVGHLRGATTFALICVSMGSSASMAPLVLHA